MKVNIQKALNYSNRKLLRPTKLVIVISSFFLVTMMMFSSVFKMSLAYASLNDFTTSYRMVIDRVVDSEQARSASQYVKEVTELEQRVSQSKQFADYRIPRYLSQH